MGPKATIFCFDGYRINRDHRTIVFRYHQEFSNRDPLSFKEKFILPEKINRLEPQFLAKFLEPLHLILGTSYYKLYCPSKVKISFLLSKEQAQFWNIVYRKGLGEFLYRNQLDPKKIAKFPSSKIKIASIRAETRNRLLLGIGGGKDSIVAAELIKKFDTSSFLLETQRPDFISRRVIEAIGFPSLIIKRILDPQLFEGHKGAYNGHIPISAVYAFSGLLLAAFYGYKAVTVGNAHSSNFGNLQYKGMAINHQWSKSVEFEALMKDYVRKFITPDIIYFSVLRQFYELRIAKLLAGYKKYLKLFTSCNRNFKVFQPRSKTLWCCQCPKCAFVFLILAPFLSKKELVEIFDKDLLDDKDLIPTFRDLLGFGKLKPFDCVGPFEESQAALALAAKNFSDSITVKTFLPKIKNTKQLVEHALQTVSAPALPTPFRFLGIETVGILGFGKEGKITQRYLKKNYPHLKIGILDQNIDKNYLQNQKDYDLVIKTPGISKNKVTVPYTTATNIFFSENKNFAIGVTGSKGKSTTASLIYEILKVANKKVRLIGNIGNPMLEVLLEKIDPQEIFVIELSSFMLDDIEYSPNIAVLLNLFPEHMDYHGGIEDYYSAKKNIFKFQTDSDHAVKPPFREKIPLERKDIPLLGTHNIKNIQAAIAVAKILKIADVAIKQAVKNFKPLPHRLEFIGTFKGIKFYDDAISTAPESTTLAIKTLKGVDTIFLGGEDRGYDFTKLEEILRLYRIRNIVLFPDTGKKILKSRLGFNILETKDMEKAVAFAFRNTQKDKICLLSTASPSYSLWKNFEEKGDLFQQLVREYPRT